MNFKNDFLAALKAGEDYDALMELVRRYQLRGLSLDTGYEMLQEIWLEYGFDEKVAEEGTLQDKLEYVMEKVWYERPAPER